MKQEAKSEINLSEDKVPIPQTFLYYELIMISNTEFIALILQPAE